jgi:hypothetical protein
MALAKYLNSGTGRNIYITYITTVEKQNAATGAKDKYGKFTSNPGRYD